MKGLEAEYKRRKILYFCKINKEAHKEICSFLSDKIVKYLLDTKYDMLKREDEKDFLSTYRQSWRYRYALHKKYYSYDYPFTASVKLERYIKSKYEMIDWLKKERTLMELHSSDPDRFWETMYNYVENENIMDDITQTIEYNYHLSKRKEIFETLSDLLSNEKYISFITLGLIQIEGLFDDYCRIKFGDKNNQGTLIEKAQKSLEGNDFVFFKMYPYFAFDIPKLRNEAAHTGMIESSDARKVAYNLILDLNTLTHLVHSESFEKFSDVKVLYNELLEIDTTERKKEDFYDALACKLVMFDKISSDHFWSILRDPDAYSDELNFYKNDKLEDGYIDLPGIIDYLSCEIKNEAFWAALHRLLNKYCSETSDWIELREFAKRMKNQYIAILDGNAKTECIEIAKLVG